MRKVLLVDDEVGILEILKEMLTDAGYRTVLAGNGKQALEVYKTEQPDLVILDWMMPLVDGPATARTLRGIKPDLPIVLMSGADERWAREYSADFTVFLRKPFRYAEVLAAVRQAIGE